MNARTIRLARWSAVVMVAVSGLASKAAEAGAPKIQHNKLADLGSEHLAHAVFRRTPSGGAIVAWGERIVEWALDQPQLRQTVAPHNNLHFSNGGCALDVDGDGTDEIVVARGRGRWCTDPELFWYQEIDSAGSWTTSSIGQVGKGPISPHDIVPITVRRPDGATARGVVTVFDRQNLAWYEIPKDPRQPWLRHNLAELPRRSQSGIAVSDLAGNGRPDVACGMFWAECPADPVRDPWRVRRFGHWEEGGWGAMTKLEAADMDGDGRLDLVATQAEIPDARLGIFSRDPQHPEDAWKYREVDQGLYCPHSLVVADLNRDGSKDIITGEMTAGGWSFPLNPRPRIIAYLNRGEKPFERRVLAEGWGVHEMGLVPPRDDGRWILFAADETQTQKFPDMKTHVSTWTITWARAAKGGLK
ncbi:MAG: VCBS repeat-containing protein [Verrucomicrobia bacterium]|nr:VCBS repeat-containing protein [Verrucomicrobiota bacterium]